MDEFVRVTVSIVFDGLAYAMILFVMSVGLSITMGLMGVVNLAHGALAMIGGYASVTLVNWLGVPLLAALPVVFLFAIAVSVPIERVLFARIYRRSHLHQVLVTIGFTMMVVAAVTFIFGMSSYSVAIPESFLTEIVIFGREFPAFRSFIIAVGVAIYLVLWFGFERSQLGAKIRAAVDNRAMAENIGIDTSWLFSLTFALGSGLAAVGGTFAGNIMGLTPHFAFQYITLMMLIVTLGGLGTISGSFLAAILVGLIENAGRYFLPSGGGVFIYLIAVAVLLFRPNGLYGRQF